MRFISDFEFQFSILCVALRPRDQSSLYNWRNVQRAHAWRLGSGYGTMSYKGLDPSKIGSKVGMRKCTGAWGVKSLKCLERLNFKNHGWTLINTDKATERGSSD